jgi:hypothetical protein
VPALGGNDGELDSAVPLDFLVGLVGRKEGGEQQSQHEGGDGKQGNCRENLAEMEGHVCSSLARRGQ